MAPSAGRLGATRGSGPASRDRAWGDGKRRRVPGRALPSRVESPADRCASPGPCARVAPLPRDPAGLTRHRPTPRPAVPGGDQLRHGRRRIRYSRAGACAQPACEPRARPGNCWKRREGATQDVDAWDVAPPGEGHERSSLEVQRGIDAGGRQGVVPEHSRDVFDTGARVHHG